MITKARASFLLFSQTLSILEKEIKHFYNGWYYQQIIKMRRLHKVLNHADEERLKGDLWFKISSEIPIKDFMIRRIEGGMSDPLDMAYIYRTFFDGYNDIITNSIIGNSKSSS